MSPQLSAIESPRANRFATPVVIAAARIEQARMLAQGTPATRCGRLAEESQCSRRFA